MRKLPLALLASLSACAGVRPVILPSGEGPMPIAKLPSDAEVLRRRADPVDPRDPALPALIDRLRATLDEAGGVGIAAPQIGVSSRVLLVKHGTRPARELHVDAYLNPTLEQVSAEVDADYEACLSVDAGGALVSRPTRVTVSYDVLGGGREKRELADWDARIMQHELDHLDGVLFIDKLAGPLVSIEEMRRLRDARHRARGWLPPEDAPTPPRSEAQTGEPSGAAPSTDPEALAR